MSDIIATDQYITKNSDFESVQPAIDPGNKPTFLIDWELTLKCNLSCSYCSSGPYGGRWNKTKHPPLEECLQTIDFMYEYVDLYMQYKKSWGQAAVLNVYGGESLVHPHIETILNASIEKYKQGNYNWPLTVTTTTNLLIKADLLKRIAPLINEFTVSWHCDSTDKQKNQVRLNIEYLRSINIKQKIVILMHSDNKHWPELFDLIDFCKQNNIDHIVRQLDGDRHSNYNDEQIKWLTGYYSSKQKNKVSSKLDKPLASQGRACCGGRSMCINQEYKNPTYWIPDNNFANWHCSVNWFFVYIKQWNKEIYVNKDCKMSFDNKVAPIGSVDNYKKLIDDTKIMLENNNMPVIQCKQSRCRCGLCAPKALTKNTFRTIMKNHVTENVFN